MIDTGAAERSGIGEEISLISKRKKEREDRGLKKKSRLVAWDCFNQQRSRRDAKVWMSAGGEKRGEAEEEPMMDDGDGERFIPTR